MLFVHIFLSLFERFVCPQDLAKRPPTFEHEPIAVVKHHFSKKRVFYTKKRNSKKREKMTPKRAQTTSQNLTFWGELHWLIRFCFAKNSFFSPNASGGQKVTSRATKNDLGGSKNDPMVAETNPKHITQHNITFSSSFSLYKKTLFFEK